MNEPSCCANTFRTNLKTQASDRSADTSVFLTISPRWIYVVFNCRKMIRLTTEAISGGWACPGGTWHRSLPTRSQSEHCRLLRGMSEQTTIGDPIPEQLQHQFVWSLQFYVRMGVFGAVASGKWIRCERRCSEGEREREREKCRCCTFLQQLTSMLSSLWCVKGAPVQKEKVGAFNSCSPLLTSRVVLRCEITLFFINMIKWSVVHWVF